ncbi:carbamoyltransferase N-terminal domain-containing protein [Rubripirellula reticaptiva]|uniref:Decarbamoylnovobiocin carbamoyltransferase n=1 Tax=Rubripirellula reticaptiva TaxID=2528013 RepID=A0A5C6F1G5_9BACT|nr:carbamoyltransferase N-terminal domain-containing protein [Rubripirellula reticaptiva]TWU55683.1 Decarbamoylnovobiocin carbamoyltransferase [Rubripirellula reticaptiva]
MFLLSQSTHRMLIQHDSDIGHRFVPNQNARLTNEAGGYFVKTNSSGFRSDFEFVKPKSGRPRILMFGDSYTAGDNVSNCDRYSDQLAKLHGCEVYNFGISGSGTDQHLLAFRKFAKQIEADAIVICVQIDSFHRIQTSHRPSVDRVTGRRVRVPKPYFELINGELNLCQVPVPTDRPEDNAGDRPPSTKRDDDLINKVHDLYSLVPGLKELRNSSLFSDAGSRLITEFKRIRGHHPYPDILSDQTGGWKLMEAILRQFIAEVQPLPVVIFPIPTRDFYLVGMEPVYQPLFEKLDSPEKNIHVGDVSTELGQLPYQERLKLSFEQGGHFTPYANRLVAENMDAFLTKRGIIKVASDKEAVTAASAARSVAASEEKPSDGEYILGLSCFYHNSAATLLKNGEIVAAAEEERFSRVKNDRRFPVNAVNFCLEQAGINQDQLSAVSFYDDSALTFERIMHSLMAVDVDSARKMWATIVPDWARTKLHFPKLVREALNFDGPVLQGNHHRSHAASCFYPSPFESAAVITIDGVGEWATASIAHGQGNSIKMLREMTFPNSLGLLYSAFTHFTGFKVNSGEYKMMGLAPYGRPIYTQLILDNIVDLKDDGSIELNMDYFSFLSDVSTTSEKFDELFGGPRRDPESRITRREMDLARSIQEVTEMAMIRMARHARELTGETRLCLAGGVALNCVANGKLLKEGVFDEIWIQPAAGDSGCALGVALDTWHTYLGRPRTERSELSDQGGSYLGPGFSSDEIKAYLDTHGFPFRELCGDDRNQFLSKQLADGKVVGHFSGRLEFGPRSLGARSILGDVRNTEMQTTLNLRIKYRESFRPFAPAVLHERVSDYFDIDRESPYMLLVAPVKESRRIPVKASEGDAAEDLLPIVRQLRSDIPAVTHIDYSARIQSVRREHHQAFYDLIKQFEKDTGYGVLVNTSFNVRGEPIVCTPQDAYRCFMRTEMDVLALDDCILIKADQPEWPEGKGEGLENEDVYAVSQAKPTDQYHDQIAKLFDSSFWPQATKAKSQDMVLVSVTTPPLRSSTWTDTSKTGMASEEFEFASAFANSNSSASQTAAAIVSRWRDQPAGRLLEPTVAKILQVASKHPRDDDEAAEVSESVYVMF